MPEPVACTIVSNNYLGFARILAHSFLEHHPNGSVYVLIVDKPAEEIDYAAEDFEVVFADEIDIPAFPHFAFKYSLLELNTAVKPFLLEYLHTRKGVSAVFYFDPDIWILQELSPLIDKLDNRNLLLTPHLLAPLDDDRRPSERNILLAGVYNLGFLGIRFNRETRDFLDWWKEKLYSYCIHKVSEGLFVDQRWMDLAPSFLDSVEILRDPGYNVAYWNLAQRRVAFHDGSWRVDGRPLRFFHFSGLNIDDLEAISKYQDRFTLGDLPGLRPLFRDYSEALQEAGFEQLRRVPYGYGVFDNGVPIPDFVRSELRRLDAAGDRWAEPFSTDSSASYLDWLQDSIRSEDGSHTLPRISLLLWEARADLQRAFPVPLGFDHAAFSGWLLSGEATASGLDPRFLSSLTAAQEPSDRNRESPSEKEAELPADGIEERVSAAASDLSTLIADAAHDSEQKPRIPRMAMLIWDDRPDVREAFAAPLGGSRRAFARWYTTFARLEYDLPQQLVAPTLQSMTLGDRTRTRLWQAFAKTGRIRTIPQGSWRLLVTPGDRANPDD